MTRSKHKLSFDAAVYERLEAEAEQRGLSVSAVVGERLAAGPQPMAAPVAPPDGMRARYINCRKCARCVANPNQGIHGPYIYDGRKYIGKPT